jgi:hypothetical protein
MIFVQIAAYRDPELVPTIQDCIANARYKEDLRFGICWQRHEDEHDLDAFRDNKAFRIDTVPWNESQGLCWARSRIQGLYEGEDYTLQIDSHHRFAPDWDVHLLKCMELTGSPKPIITTYAGMYEPGSNQKLGVEPYSMVADRFTPSGTILFRPHTIKGWEQLSKPVRARFVSGHFFFTTGKHCEEYKYDPNLYFAGDEISLSIRSFTLGYDLFHPHRTYVWHEYTRKGRTKHWDDHSVTNKALVGAAWHERDLISKKRLRKMLQEEDNDAEIGEYGLGQVRTHGDYERYAGINFGSRRLHKETVQGLEPPCTYVDEHHWEKAFLSDYRLAMEWKVEDIEPCDDYQFIYFGIEDESGNVLYRYDAAASSPETRRLNQCKEVQFSAASKPAKLVVWPVSRTKGWLKKVTYTL